MGLYDRYLAVRHRLRAETTPDHVAVVLTERDLLEQGAYDRLSRVLRWATDYGSDRVTVFVSVLDEAVLDTLERELTDLDTPLPASVHRPSDTGDRSVESAESPGASIESASAESPGASIESASAESPGASTKRPGDRSEQAERSSDRSEQAVDRHVSDGQSVDSRSSGSPAADGEAPIRINIGLGGRREFAAAVREIARAVERGELSPEEIDADDVEGRLVFPEEPDLLVKTGAERLSDFMIWQSVYSELYFTDVNWRDFRKRDYLRALLEYDRRNRRFGR